MKFALFSKPRLLSRTPRFILVITYTTGVYTSKLLLPRFCMGNMQNLNLHITYIFVRLMDNGRKSPKLRIRELRPQTVQTGSHKMPGRSLKMYGYVYQM